MFISMNTLFSLINFGILIAFSVYVYRIYIKNILFEHMQAQEDAVRLLEQEEIALKEESIRLTKLMQEEQSNAVELLEKVTRWRNKQNQEQENQEKEQQHIQASLKLKAHKQSQWYAQYQLAQRLLPQVVVKTRAKLDAGLQSPGKQSAYMQEIITFMKKSNS